MATSGKQIQQQQQQQQQQAVSVIKLKEECNVCGVKDVRLLRCSRCKNVLYCGQQHQREDWKTHKAVCVAPTTRTNASGQQHQNKKSLPAPTKSVEASSSKHQDSIPSNPRSQYIPLYSIKDFDMNIDDYLITPSPARNKMTVDELSSREKAKQNADLLVEKLTTRGYSIIDNYLGELNCAKVLWDVREILHAGIMKPGQVVSKTKEKVRGDKIAWITGTEEMYPNMRIVMDTVDRLIRYCDGRLGNIKGRTPAMVACYPGDGTGYKRHVDNTVKDGRRITCLYYLNKGWDSEEMGGQLRMFPTLTNEQVDIDPLFDRLVVFWSDSRTPHEVLPANHQRFAVTLWYFDAEEREHVKEKYFSNLKNAFASNMHVTNNQDSGNTSKRVPAYEVIDQPGDDVDDDEASVNLPTT